MLVIQPSTQHATWQAETNAQEPQVSPASTACQCSRSRLQTSTTKQETIGNVKCPLSKSKFEARNACSFFPTFCKLEGSIVNSTFSRGGRLDLSVLGISTIDSYLPQVFIILTRHITRYDADIHTPHGRSRRAAALSLAAADSKGNSVVPLVAFVTALLDIMRRGSIGLIKRKGSEQADVFGRAASVLYPSL